MAEKRRQKSITEKEQIKYKKFQEDIKWIKRALKGEGNSACVRVMDMDTKKTFTISRHNIPRHKKYPDTIHAEMMIKKEIEMMRKNGKRS